ncbi:hypothetical protein EUTSA_v10000747mg [Eutrema salsugineum]|uniref:ADP-ribosyl cyclase/cyclic ADP-ribose hydrolase n=1 Tax=Eutrema salsugineum TaxID=72664 RepID=V4KP22_EUTSA|nr:hypothetical protein EUTSA_v10000747mg [Eutrema salsugineum]
MVTTLSSSDVKVGPEVFINFRGDELRKSFISHLYSRLRSEGINAFIDTDEGAGQELENLFKRIEESKIALAVLSSRYTESHWCLQELVKIKECSMKSEGCNNNLFVIPIFYKLETSTVRELTGKFGLNLWDLWRVPGHDRNRDNRIVKWNEALENVLGKKALILTETGKEDDFLSTIVTHVKNALGAISSKRGKNPKPHNGGGVNPKPKKCLTISSNNTEPGEQRLKELEGKLDVHCNDNDTRILGLVGMPGIGKTYLAKKLFDKLKNRIIYCVFIQFERQKSKEQGAEWLQKRLVEGLLDQDDLKLRCADQNAVESWMKRLGKYKIVVILDNVIDREQIDEVIRNQDWIKKGSRIVITTRDKSILEGLACDLYEVPELNEREGLELFRAQMCTTLEGSFMELSRKFVDFSGGNPLALKAFGEELCGKDKSHWEARLGTLTQCSNQNIGRQLRICFNELNEQQKDAFLDIANFFRSQDEHYIRSLLDSSGPEYVGARNELSDLLDKFLIRLSDGRVEMHDLLITMAKELAKTSGGKYWLFPSRFAGSTNTLKNKEGKEKVRGIILDMSKMEEKPLHNQAFVGMRSLRYLKIYYSLGPKHREVECKLNLPDGIEFPEDNIVRYLDWVNFPGNELPSDFEPKNLIDLRLPYSKITRVWNCAKVAPNLKWVDLSHSSNLSSILGLSDAPNLLRLNLEGCKSLKGLPEEMQKMKNLVFLNLRGCTSLLSLPKITMDSLKTLILSDCSKFHTFEVISGSLETLYLNGTAIDGLPPAIGNLHGLIFLNLKDCKYLATLPDFIWKLRSLQELKLSRCSRLNSFSIDKENMVKLRVLLLDETSIAEIPANITYLSSLRRLCLSRNDTICSIQFDMDELLHLKWLELKCCKNLTSLSRLPPKLQCLNAHDCTSLRTLESPVTLLMPTEQIHSTFIFTNCHELEQTSKNAIISYFQKKSKLMSDDRYNQDFVFKALISTCFPGCEVPAWFNHKALGSVLELELPQGWNEERITGIALSVVVSFNGCTDQNNSLQVKCTCEFTNVSLSSESFIVGGWSEPDEEPHTVKSEHVFIGYTTWFNIKKRQQHSSVDSVSLRFEVTNGTSTVAECEVMKCGFSLVYEPEEAENTSCEENSRMDKSSSFTVDNDDCPANSDATPTTADYKRFNSIFEFFRKER